MCCAQLLDHVQLFATPWTIISQDPLSMEFSCSKNTDTPPVYLPNPRMEPVSPASPAMAGRFVSLSHLRKQCKK